MEKVKYLLYIFLIMNLAACTTHKKITYLHDLNTEQPEEQFVTPSSDYKIQKKDILYVNIMTLDPEINEVFNPFMAGNTTIYLQYESTQYLYGYTLNDSGCISLPIIGNVKLINKTLGEAEKVIENTAQKYIKEPNATVKLLSYKYSVLGDVNIPGTYPSFNPQLTIFEALSKAGDISDYGNRKKVHVIRSSEDTTIIAHLNLSLKEVFNSDYFYILPNDVIYVEPLKYKSFRMNIPTISVGLGAISAMVLILNYMDKK